MNVPLCPMCGGRGTVECNDEGAAEYGHFTKPPNGCVRVRVLGVTRFDGTRYLDPAVVKPWCETHESPLSPQQSAPRDVCLARLTDNHDRPGPCHLVAVRIEKLGELA